MTSRQVGDEMLNAYVDGELSSAEAAEVARAAAQDSAIAARIASLREMKAAVADLVPAATLTLPEEPRRRARALPLAAAAASLAAVLVVGAMLSGLLRLDSRPDWPSVLESHHRSWAFNQAAEAAWPMPASAASDGLEALDLSAARLILVGRERIAYRHVTLDRIGYQGPHGCRLSLFVVPRNLNVARHAFPPPFDVRVWSQGDSELLLMAEGMAAARFRELGDAIERALRDHRPFDAETRQRLVQVTEISRPCRA